MIGGGGDGGGDDGSYSELIEKISSSARVTI